MAEVLLDVRNLSVDYSLPKGNLHRAVDSVSFNLVAGETLGIVGESGCGKSSLARAILQLENYQGSVSLLGQELGSVSMASLRAARRQMQAVFQDPLASLNPRMTVMRVIEEPLRIHCRELDEAARRDRVFEMLNRIGLEKEYAASYPHELSGGQCQRVGIARAVICEPSLVICDEPVSALDTSVRGQILSLLETLRRELNIGLIFIAHDMTAVRYLCDRVMVMFDGRVVEMASRENLFQSAAHPYTRALLQAVLPPDPDAQPPRDTSLEITEEHGKKGCRYRGRCAYAIDACETDEPPLRALNESQVACLRAGEIDFETEGSGS